MNEQEQALADFLENNPKAQKRQHMINIRLNRCRSTLARNFLIQEMMQDYIFKLSEVWNNGLTTQCKVLELKKIPMLRDQAE